MQTNYGPINRTHFRSKSVVPYLLFSPYSPLALMEMPPVRPSDDPFWWDRDQFTYCDAFEDLLRASIGENMRDLTSNPLERVIKSLLTGEHSWPAPRYGFFYLRPEELTLADMGMVWMRTALAHRDVLQDDSLYGIVSSDSFGTLYTHKPSLIASILENFMLNLSDSQDDLALHANANTEQDMYDRFFSLDSNLGKGEHLGGTVRELLAMLQAEGRAISDVFNSTDPTKQAESFQRAPLSATRTQSSKLNSHESPNAYQTVESPLLEGTTSIPRSNVPSNERVVSSTTSTSQETDEDGTVRTTVVIEKRFENGRKSVTETKHVQLPQRDKFERRTGDGQLDNGETGKGDDKGVNKRSKGWFWN